MRSLLSALLLAACTTPPPTSPVRHTGAMREVMWEGRLGGQVALDTVANAPGAYAVGPLENLVGEITVLDGVSYVSRVTSDSTMSVERTAAVTAPFLVYARAAGFTEVPLPDTVGDIATLEAFLDAYSAQLPRPFVFRLDGNIDEALVHVQNLPPGTVVRSPKDGHRGQVKYLLREREASVVGFFSTEHQGVFTHHDSYVHLHLVAADETMMGHVDELRFAPGALRLRVGE